MHISVRFLI